MKTKDIFRKHNFALLQKILEKPCNFHDFKTDVHNPIFNQPIKTIQDAKNEAKTTVKPTENTNEKPHNNLERLFFRYESQRN